MKYFFIFVVFLFPFHALFADTYEFFAPVPHKGILQNHFYLGPYSRIDQNNLATNNEISYICVSPTKNGKTYAIHQKKPYISVPVMFERTQEKIQSYIQTYSALFQKRGKYFHFRDQEMKLYAFPLKINQQNAGLFGRLVKYRADHPKNTPHIARCFEHTSFSELLFEKTQTGNILKIHLQYPIGTLFEVRSNQFAPTRAITVAQNYHSLNALKKIGKEGEMIYEKGFVWGNMQSIRLPSKKIQKILNSHIVFYHPKIGFAKEIYGITLDGERINIMQYFTDADNGTGIYSDEFSDFFVGNEGTFIPDTIATIELHY